MAVSRENFSLPPNVGREPLGLSCSLLGKVSLVI